MSNIVKPVILPGFMELLPREQKEFERLKNIIIRNYEKYGFLPIDTPVIEKSEVLLVKSGGETEKQVYRFEKGDTDMSLRFDLTVPLARYTAKNYSELEFPFKRYQIGKVYRGERNQRGRFREFYQCDIDIIGNGKLALANDAELVAVVNSIFEEFNFSNFTIKINNRKILSGFFKSLGVSDAMSVIRTVDKLDKIGLDKVKSELSDLGVEDDAIERIMAFMEIEGDIDDMLSSIDELSICDELFAEGISEMRALVEYIKCYGVSQEHYKWDLKLARGLDYYTGTVYETVLDDYPSLGSVCGGGRYDNLAGFYTKNCLPGVGVSIGLTRLFFQLNDAGLIKYEDSSTVDAIIIPMGDYISESIRVQAELTKHSISCQTYFESAKTAKKFNYADKLNISYAVIIGEDEIQKDVYTLRDMRNGSQEQLKLDQLIERLGRK